MRWYGFVSEKPLFLPDIPRQSAHHALAWLGQRQAAITFLRYALSSTSGDLAFDRWLAAWQQAIGDNTGAVLAELEAGIGEELQPAQIVTISCPVTCLRGALSQPFLVEGNRALDMPISPRDL